MKRLILWCALLFGGCAPRSEYVTFTGFQQGTTYSIIVRDPAPDAAARIDSVFREIDITLSMFNPESLVSRINRGETDRVTPLFAECFRLAEQIHADTEGFYDPTVKPLIDAWGFGPGEMQRHPNLDSLMAFVGLDKIVLENNKIIKKDPRVQLDFSSIAKGFTVDKMAEMLARTSGGGRRAGSEGGWHRRSGGNSRKHSDGAGASAGSRAGVDSSLAFCSGAGSGNVPDGGGADFLVEIGGEIRVQGVNRQGVAWRVQIDRPEGGFAHQQAAVITLGGRDSRNADRSSGRSSHSSDDGAGSEPEYPSSACGLARDDKTSASRGDKTSGSRDDKTSAGRDEKSGETVVRLSAVATSGNYRNHFVDADGATRVHTIDPHTGAPAAGQILSASVVSGSCALSDGWATALIAARDLATARRLLDKTALEWYIIADNGVEQSPGFPIDPK